jgi:hypothetical protein
MAMLNKVDAFPELAEAVTQPERRVVEMAADGSSGRRRSLSLQKKLLWSLYDVSETVYQHGLII